jgi:glycosyltransferase involved in cell wall biosynthesis
LWFEKKALQRETRNINGSQLVLALFPLSAAFIKANYNQKNTHYLGNVINAVQEPQKGFILDHKLRFKKIIFIGNKKYLNGAKQLIEAFHFLNSDDVELHMIGLTREETRDHTKNIYHHGYLDKGNERQCQTYYQLLSQCALIVNTNEGWGAISAVIEAMYFYTAVITTPYNEFTETFGKEINFGSYANSNTKEALAKLIKETLDLQPQKKMQTLENAHLAVRDLTWKNYSDKLVRQIESLI